MHGDERRNLVDRFGGARWSNPVLLAACALTAGAATAAALIARGRQRSPEEPVLYSDYEELNHSAAAPRRRILGWIWPPALAALALSALRTWRTPRSSAPLAFWTAMRAPLRRRHAPSHTIH